jgi:hypothetical protein
MINSLFSLRVLPALTAVVAGLTITLACSVSRVEAIDSQVAFENDPGSVSASSITLESVLSTVIDLKKRGFVVVTTGADDDGATGSFCEISIGVGDPATPAVFTEVFEARKTYQSQNLLLSNTYVVGPLDEGDHLLHFLFKKNAPTSSCSIRQRTIVGIYVPRDSTGAVPPAP